MELMHVRAAGPRQNRDSAHQRRVLMSTSGNVQNFGGDSKNHFDFRKPYLNDHCAVSEPQYPPVPLPVLGSNDRQGANGRHAARKSNRGSHPSLRRLYDRPYLHHPKYLTYRERKRLDVGKDGKPVWPDHIEESFQNAIVQIPPMGRRKKTQYGRPHGRNELIAEWIYQETGVRRHRKQVSSHIQVLGNILKGIPEWDELTAYHEEQEKNGNACEYYYGSIADQVRQQRHAMAQAKKECGESDTWFDLASQQYHLTRLTFDMWVGMPEDVTKALHNYTRVRSCHIRGSSTQLGSISGRDGVVNNPHTPDVPLENFKNWRTRFPDLEVSLRSSEDVCDMILIKSKFSLMSDFPPKASKLGLVLDLDFRSDSKENLQALSEMNYWSSTNHMYLNGECFRKTEHKECQVTESGVVKPFFEAEWWATQFTKTTHKRKKAEDSKDQGAIADADEYSRSLFKSLTIMQEISASAYPGHSPAVPAKRMAILLWVFSRSDNGHSGMTTWQRVIPPPNRMATNSPASSNIETALPPLALDSMVEGSFDIDMMDHGFSQHTNEPEIIMSPDLYDESMYHTGFTPLQTMSNDQLRLLDLSNGTGFTPKQADFANVKYEPFDFAAPIRSVATFPSSQHGHTVHDQMSAFFDLSTNTNHLKHQLDMQQAYNMPAPIAVSPFDRRHSLAKFDMNTHQMLQAQLGEMDDNYDTPTALSEHDLQQSFDSQHSMVGHMTSLDLEQEQMSQSLMAATAVTNIDSLESERVAMDHHPTAFISPKITRPPLMGHNSFAGVLHNNTAEHLVFDTPAREDFERLINNHYGNSSPNDLFGGFHPDFHRPRSQPVLSSNDVDRFDVMDFNTPSHAQSLESQIKLECE